MKKYGLLFLIGMTAHFNSWAATYTFTGPNYNAPTPFTAPCAIPTCTNFTVAMKQTGSFTTAAPLAPNLNNVNITNLILSYTFNDGITQYSNSDAASSLSFANVSTNAAGDITDENINIARWQTASHGVNDRLNVLSVNLGSYSNIYCQGLSAPDRCGLAAEDASSSYVFAKGSNNWVTNLAPPVVPVVPVVPGAGVASVPTLGEWGVLLLSFLMIGLGWWKTRRLPLPRRAGF